MSAPSRTSPTQKDLTATLLEKVMVLITEVSDIKAQVGDVNKTIHNGMSTAIKETAKKVVQIEDRLEKVDTKVDNVISNGHPTSCLYIKAKEEDRTKRMGRVAHFSNGQKVVMWIVSFLGAIGASYGTWQALLK